jgi:hypothetical protein
VNYKCTADITWIVETYGLLIVHPDRGAFCSLHYPPAAVWDFMTRGYNTAKIAKMILYIGGFPDPGESARYVQRCFESWEKVGLVRELESGERDV